MAIHRGLERSQFLMICHTGYCDGLERSQFALISNFHPNGLERSQMSPYMKGLERSQCALFH